MLMQHWLLVETTCICHTTVSWQDVTAHITLQNYLGLHYWLNYAQKDVLDLLMSLTQTPVKVNRRHQLKDLVYLGQYLKDAEENHLRIDFLQP